MQKLQSDERKEDNDKRRPAWFLWVSEVSMVAISVLVFFGFLTLLIKAFFPQAVSLIGDTDGALIASSWRGDVELGIDAVEGEVEQLIAGEILTIQRRVKHRDANSLAWDVANIGDRIVRNDAVQTFTRSTAMLGVNSASKLTMGENSLIIFDQQQADPFLSDSKAVLVMINGELSGNLIGDDKSRFRFGVNLPNSNVTLQPRTLGEDVEFLITVNDDQSTTVNIHKGTAQVVAADGTLRTIGDQQAITIDSTGTSLRVSKLARAPKPTGPSNNTAVTYRNVPEQIHFRWSEVANADRYHIVIARDAEFSDRVVDDNVVGTSFTHGALGPGNYYWHVRSRTGWAQSAQSTVRRLSVSQDLDPPALVLDQPPDRIQAGAWRLLGLTDADATVFVDEIPVPHDGGRINHPVELRPGANVIVVKAIDRVGNLSYAPLLVNAK